MALVRSMNRMVSWPVSRSVGRLVGGMVDWLVWLVVIGGWWRQIILSYKITNNIIGVLRANSLVAPWPGVCIVYRTSQHDRCDAPLGPFGFVFVFRKNVFRFYFYWFGFFLIVLFKFKIFFWDPGEIAGECGRRVTSTRLAAGLQSTLQVAPELWEEARRGGVAE